ncbi:hypothetical protein GCM10011515_11100 [Tsuneonella deserti]|uniref:Uncharacterized protein n=1 Tax=Tsuneonella deserti TaxID=2035528 RepID=A0ABQ1S6Z5_9SPHN|nr:hypothetical protein [Tsuneonella deserti]GGD93117.1 hypothetical protein GCM10011515_11100 [Tsuneonella deserti]
MSIATIIIALILIFIAWKVVKGVIKFGLIALIVVAAIYFLGQGGMG